MKSRLVALVALFLAAAAVGLWRDRSRQPASPEAESGAAPGATRVAAAVDSLRRERERLDRTVWAQEVAAQEHEERFVALWDDLRAHADDPWPVLEAFAFGRLQLGKLQDRSPKEDGITIARWGGDGERLDSGSWKAWLRRWRDRGYELVQSEWHHQRFDPLADGRARSKVSMTLHVRHPATETRFIVKGMLEVTWSRERNAAGQYDIEAIDARDLRILSRRGAPPFEPWTVLTADRDIQPVLVEDLDGDGRSEIVLAGANALYWNRGENGFESAPLCRYAPHDVSAALLADLDGDGALDLLTAGARDVPVWFRGPVTDAGFAEPGNVIQLPEPLVTPQVITAGDADADGDLDVWIGQYRPPYREGQMPTPYWDANDGYPAYYLRNLGDGRFADATVEAGLQAKRFRRTYSASFVDLDEDGDLDLLVASDFSGLDVYVNDGQGRFEDVTSRAIDEPANFGMAHALADFNDDGHLDFYVLGMSSTTARRLEAMGAGRAEFPEHQKMRMRMGYGNRLYFGDGAGNYRQAPFNDRVARSGWSWGVTAFDLENDGDLELYVANGHQSRTTAKDYCTTFWRHDIYTGDSKPDPETQQFFDGLIRDMAQQGVSWNGFEHNHLFLRCGPEEFLNVGFLMGVAFEFDARAVVGDDLDGDGRSDLLVVQAESLDPQAPPGERLHVLRNVWPRPGHWLGVRVGRGPAGASPLGAEILLQAASRQRRAVVVAGDSFRSQHPAQRHFGLGGIQRVDRVVVRWSDGTRQERRDLAADGVVVFGDVGTRGATAPGRMPASAPGASSGR